MYYLSLPKKIRSKAFRQAAWWRIDTVVDVFFCQKNGIVVALVGGFGEACAGAERQRRRDWIAKELELGDGLLLIGVAAPTPTRCTPSMAAVVRRLQLFPQRSRLWWPCRGSQRSHVAATAWRWPQHVQRRRTPTSRGHCRAAPPSCHNRSRGRRSGDQKDRWTALSANVTEC